MAGRTSRHLRARAADLGRRRSNGLRNMGMAIVVLVALLALGGQFASGAAGCFSSVTENPAAPLEMGGEQGASEEPSEESRARGVRIQVQTAPIQVQKGPVQVQTAPIPMPAGSDAQP